MKLTTLNQVKPGDYVRLVNSETTPTWVRGEYDRATRTYDLYRFDDVNKHTTRKGTCLVYVGFTF